MTETKKELKIDAGHWVTNTIGMNTSDQGVLVCLLCAKTASGDLPENVQQLAKLCGVEWRTLRSFLAKHPDWESMKVT